MARTVIVGSGVVGSATGMGFAHAGHAVTFIDTNPERVQQLRDGAYAASTTLDLSGGQAFVFLTLPTPNVGNHYELSAFRAGTEAVGLALQGASDFHTIVVRSTVPPGTCDNIVKPILEQASGKKAGIDFALASNPEFLRAACAREDFLNPWMTVIGSRSKRTVERLRELYVGFPGEMRTFSSTAAAEFVKCAHNLYNATKISFWNEMGRVAARSEVDIHEVAATVAASAEGKHQSGVRHQVGSSVRGRMPPEGHPRVPRLRRRAGRRDAADLREHALAETNGNAQKSAA